MQMRMQLRMELRVVRPQAGSPVNQRIRRPMPPDDAAGFPTDPSDRQSALGSGPTVEYHAQARTLSESYRFPLE
jgi:hypothetical protein